MGPRQRDLFPLPSFDKHILDTQPVSRSIRRRIQKKNNNIDWANEGVRTLNHLSGVQSTDSDSCVAPNASSAESSQHLFDAYADMPPPDSELSPEGALSEL